MKFKNLKKNKKRSIRIIGFILVLLGFLVTFTLFKTFAFYEEKKSFNILKGRVPEFSQEDIQLSFTIDGIKEEKFPAISDGYAGVSTICSDGASAYWDNGSWSLTNINSNGNKKVYCSVNFISRENINLYENVRVGDYVSYTPILSQYVVNKTETGSVENQTLRPSELNLWRVIRKNNDGTIELISEYVSSSGINFAGKNGYKNFVGSLNKIANSYETSGITSGSRCIGYDGQTEYITDDTKLDYTDNLPFSTNSYFDDSLKKKGTEREMLGGGDQLFITDKNLVLNALNTLHAKRVYTDEFGDYWIASRIYAWPTKTSWYYNGYAYSHTKEDFVYNYHIYYYENERFIVGSHVYKNAIRPIVILKSGIASINGDGTLDSPWKVN